MQIKIKNTASQTVKQHFFFFCEGQWASYGETFRSSTGDLFAGKKNETFITVDSDNVNFFVGLGKNPKNFEIQSITSKFSYDFRKKIKESPTTINITDTDGSWTEAILTGLFLGTYEYPFKEKHPLFSENFEFVLKGSAQAANEISAKVKALCAGEFACREWLNKPQNFKKVTHLSDYLKDISEKYNFKLTVYDRQKSQELGLGAFLAVSQGSAQDCAFTIIEYRCGLETAKTVGLVGKCVLFDTGGISVKPSENMHYMKSDMGGATAVIGTLVTAAERKLPVNIVAVLPITDNAVSNNAYCPSDVITAYNGKTIEILNTDAEGRMTLADGLSYLSKNYETDILIDLATLTGSSVRMFGHTCGALFSNDRNLQTALETAADFTNQRLWNMPLWDVWKDEFTSDVADFKNISLKPVGDCIVAAKFLEQFIEGHPRWAHLDIAGVAFGNVPYAKEKAATGYGVQLLINFLENID
jgi:leucyl aminopeptidase